MIDPGWDKPEIVKLTCSLEEQAELFKEYSDILKMCVKFGFSKPWDCVKVDGTVYGGSNNPSFKLLYDTYEFSLGILDGRPIFKGDKVYSYGKEYKFDSQNFDGFWLSSGTFFPCVSRNLGELTWNPPVKEKTFMLGNNTYVSPTSSIPKIAGWSCINFDGVYFYWDSSIKMNAATDAIKALLRGEI